MDARTSEEYDADVAQDEALAAGGLYEVPLVEGAAWKILVVAGAALLVATVILELMVRGYLFPIPEYFPTVLGSAFVLAVLLVGVLCLGGGIAAYLVRRRAPAPLKPIV